MATIKLKHTPASQLFKRLGAYSIQHPLYKALKEFGRIIKSIFLLKYIDDVELRQIVEKLLNKIESANKFKKAVFHGNNQEYQYSSKEEQLVADGCCRLIQNVITCWNYLYLTQLIFETESDVKREQMINGIKQKSVVAWQHINLLGEYNFNKNSLKNRRIFDVSKLLNMDFAKSGNFF